MIIRCDNCSVSLQLDEAKLPNGNFTVRCPRCQNMLRANRNLGNAAQQLAENKPAQAMQQGAQQFTERENEFEINNALKALLGALSMGKSTLDVDEKAEKPRRVLLCLGEKKDTVAKILAGAGYRVYIA